MQDRGELFVYMHVFTHIISLYLIIHGKTNIFYIHLCQKVAKIFINLKHKHHVSLSFFFSPEKSSINILCLAFSYTCSE